MTTNDLLLIGLGLKKGPKAPKAQKRYDGEGDIRSRIPRTELQALEMLVVSQFNGRPFTVAEFHRDMILAGCPMALMTAHNHVKKIPGVRQRADGKWESV